MTDAELDALVSDLNHTGELSILYRMEIADAITAMRAELAAERAKVKALVDAMPDEIELYRIMKKWPGRRMIDYARGVAHHLAAITREVTP